MVGGSLIAAHARRETRPGGLKPCLTHDVNGAVIIAVIAMRVMQVAINQVIDVVAVRHRGVSAVGSVHVLGVMAFAPMIRRTRIGVGRIDLERVLLDDPVIPLVVQVAIMQIAHVVVVTNGRVPAVRAVFVRVICVRIHRMLLPCKGVRVRVTCMFQSVAN